MNNITRALTKWFETLPMSNETGKKPIKKTRNVNRNERAQLFKKDLYQLLLNLFATGSSLDWRYSFLLNFEICNLVIKKCKVNTNFHIELLLLLYNVFRNTIVLQEHLQWNFEKLLVKPSKKGCVFSKGGFPSFITFNFYKIVDWRWSASSIRDAFSIRRITLLRYQS